MSACVRSAITCVALAAAANCSGQATSARDSARDAAWQVLDSAWAAAGHGDWKDSVLGSLARVRSARATEMFRKALRESPGMPAQAAIMLSEERVSELLPEISERLRTDRDVNAEIWLISCLRKLHSRTAADLVAPFAMEDHEPVTGVAFGVLNDLGPIATPVLETVLKQGCFKCRESAAYVLRAAPGVGPAFREALGDANPDVRVLAAAALARSGDSSGVEVLRTAATGTEYEYRIRAALALYNLGELQYQGVLLKEMETAKTADRFFAVREILREGHSPLRDLVYGMAQRDASAEVRLAYLEVMPESAKTASAYLPLVRDLDSGVRLFAAKELLARHAATAESDNVLSNAFLNASPGEQEQILTALADSGADTRTERDMVETALRSSSVVVQAAAIRGMKSWGQEAAQRLAPMLETTDDVYLLATAADALVGISPSDAVPILLGRLQSSKPLVRTVSAGYLLYALEASQ